MKMTTSTEKKSLNEHVAETHQNKPVTGKVVTGDVVAGEVTADQEAEDDSETESGDDGEAV